MKAAEKPVDTYRPAGVDWGVHNLGRGTAAGRI